MSSARLLLTQLKAIEKGISEISGILDEVAREISSETCIEHDSADKRITNSPLACPRCNGLGQKMDNGVLQRKPQRALRNHKQEIGCAVPEFHEPIYLLNGGKGCGKREIFGCWVVFISCVAFGLSLCFQHADLLRSCYNCILRFIDERRMQLEGYLPTQKPQSAVVKKLFVD